MLDVVNIIVPVFSIIALAYWLARFPLFGGDLHQKLTDFVFWVPVPALMFRTLSTADFSGGSPFAVWALYFPAIAFIWLSAQILSKIVFGFDDAKSIIAGLTTSFSNMVLVGMPVILSAYGSSGLPPLLLIISIHMPVMMTVVTLLITRANVRAEGTSGMSAARTLFRNLSRNPIVISLIAGALWRFTGLSLATPIARTVDQLAQITAPTALFALGLSLYQFGFNRQLLPPLTLGLLKLVIFPLIVFCGATYLTDLQPVWISALTLCAACPSGVNPYLISNQFRTGQQLTSQTITLTTFASIFTLSMWLGVLRSMFDAS